MSYVAWLIAYYVFVPAVISLLQRWLLELWL